MADSKPAVIATELRGIDERWDPDGQGGITASVAQDLWYDPRGSWSSAGGYLRIIRGPPMFPAPDPPTYTNPFASSGAIESVHWLSQHTGARRWLIYIDGTGALYAFNPATAARSASPGDQARDRSGNLITRTVVTGPWIRHQSATWGDVLYLVNGIDIPLVFNGYVWDMAGWGSPAGIVTATGMEAPRATDNGGAASVKIPNVGLGPTSDSTGTQYDYKFARRYRCSYINERGAESPLSEPSDLVYFVNIGGTDSTDGAHFSKVDLPIGPPSTIKRRLYCTQNVYDSSNVLIPGRLDQFFLWGDIPDNVTVTMQDSHDDAVIGVIPVDPLAFGTFPTSCTIIATYNNRMYATGNGSSQVYYSTRGNPEVWPVLNVLNIGDDQSGPVKVMYATRNVLVVAKERCIYLIADDGVNEPQPRRLTGSSGWSAQNTVREIPGIGIMGLSSNGGVTVLKGTLQNEGVETETLNASVGLPETMARMNASAITNACAVVYPKDKEYWLSIPMLGSPNNNLVLVFHYEVREWTTRPYYPIASMLVTPDAVGLLIFASYAATAGVSPDGVAHLGIFVYTRGAADKDGTAITPVYQTNQVGVASKFRTFKPLHVLPRGILHGLNKLQCGLYINYSPTPSSTTQSQSQIYPQQFMPVYGDGSTVGSVNYDSGKKWTRWFPGTTRFDVPGDVGQPTFTASIRFEPQAGKRYMTIDALSLEIQPGDPTDTKPIKPDGTN
jgi:hypothetical protein